MFRCSQRFSAAGYPALWEVATARPGLAFREKLEPDAAGGLRVVQAKDIGESGTIDVAAAVIVADQRATAHHLLKRGDVVFQSRGAAIRAGLVAEDVIDTVAAAPLQIIRPNIDRILPAFLVLALNMPTTIAALLQQARGSHIPQVPLEAVRNVCLPLPDLNRQAAIVALATFIDAEKRIFDEIVALRIRLLEAVVAESAQNTQRQAKARG